MLAGPIERNRKFASSGFVERLIIVVSRGRVPVCATTGTAVIASARQKKAGRKSESSNERLYNADRVILRTLSEAKGTKDPSAAEEES